MCHFTSAEHGVARESTGEPQFDSPVSGFSSLKRNESTALDMDHTYYHTSDVIKNAEIVKDQVEILRADHIGGSYKVMLRL